MKRFLLILIITFSVFLLRAQYYSIGQDPSTIRWRQINTAHFQVIYPSTFETKAQRFASVLENVYRYAGQSLNHHPHKISVILHTRTVLSNGLVSWAPSRMELFTTPPQDVYAHDWMEQLAIHEFRHVVQMDKIESELPNILKLILGEQAAAAVVGAYLPLWFLEGDAVAAETALSQSGRGRLPSFEMELKAQVLDKKIYSYDKSYLGSYKDYIPDYYQMGYQLVAGARKTYSAEVWGSVLHHVARNPLGITSFSKGLKKSTGKNQERLYSSIFEDLKQQWIEEDKHLIKNKFNQITKASEDYTNYSYPFYVNDSTFFALKNSINDVQRFVLINKYGKEKRIFTPGYISEESVHVVDHKVFWIERKPDPRWANQEYSLLRIYDIRNGKLFEKRFEEKIFSPSLSFDKKYLSFVKVSRENDYSFLIISPETGKIIRDIPTPDNLFPITPTWAEKENQIYSVVLGKEGKSLIRFNPTTNEVKFLLPYSNNNLKEPIQRSGYLFFNSSQSGTDNIYAIELEGNKMFQVTSSRFGTIDPQPSSNGKNMIYGDYTANGFRIVQISLDKNQWFSTMPSITFRNSLAEKISQQEKNIIPPVADTITYDSKSYSKIGHLFNFHSWAPFRIDDNQENIRPGFSVLSQNMLSTAVTQVGYDYSTINKSGKWFAKFDYSGLFPVLGFAFEYGRQKSHYNRITNYTNQVGQIVRTDTSTIGFSYHELNIDGSIKLPFDLTHGKYVRFIQPEFQAGYSSIKLAPSAPSNLFHGSIVPFTYRLYASNYVTAGIRDLQPKIGQAVDLVYRHSPFGDLRYGTILSGEGILFFPGFWDHHGIRIYGGYQKKESSSQSFSDLIEYPRGYQNVINKNLFTFRTDYVFPLFYPDWSLGKMSYIKRVSIRLFYDRGSAQIPLANNSILHSSFNSTGTELMLNCHFFRFIFPSTVGVRGSYLLEKRDLVFEFIYSMNFSGFRTFNKVR